jgi:hypothetical protein
LEQSIQQHSKSTVARASFGIVLAMLAMLAWFVPYYDWDLAAYVGAAIATHEQDPAKIHSQTYSALRQELPDDAYKEISSSSEFRRDVAQNPQHFFQQLRFYQIRPLFIRTLVVLHAMGIGYVAASRLISVAAFLGMGVLLFLWARRSAGDLASTVCVSLLLFAPVIFTSVRTGSPDALSAFVVLLGTYLLFERKQTLLPALLLLGSLFIRTDNIILVVLLFGWQASISITRRARSYWTAAALLAIVCVVSINHIEHSYGWPMLMQNTETPVVNPAEITPEFSLHDYFAAWADTIDEARENSIMVFPFIAALVLLGRGEQKLKALVTVVLLSWIVRLILFPHIEDRYFISGSAIIGIAAISALAGRNMARNP